MTHDEMARELWRKEKDNIARVTYVKSYLKGYDDGKMLCDNTTPVVEVANHYYCKCCDVIIDRYKANYCYNCGKKLDWNKVERSFSNACTARFYKEERGLERKAF